VPLPEVYAELLKKAEAGTLQINYGDTVAEPKFFLARMFAPKKKKTELPPMAMLCGTPATQVLLPGFGSET